MCGATDQQKDIEQAQANFYNTLTANYNIAFANESAILDTLSSELKPIFEKGPDQEGFGPQELTALNTQADEGVARSYATAAKDVREQEGAASGGEFIPSGQSAQEEATLANAALSERAGLKQQITEADYATGRAEWEYAASGLEGVASGWNPNAGAEVANAGGTAAATTANEIAQENNSIWNSVIGGLSGIAGAAAGGAALGATEPSPTPTPTH